jgi:hypothetical protein
VVVRLEDYTRVPAERDEGRGAIGAHGAERELAAYGGPWNVVQPGLFE